MPCPNPHCYRILFQSHSTGSCLLQNLGRIYPFLYLFLYYFLLGCYSERRSHYSAKKIENLIFVLFIFWEKTKKISTFVLPMYFSVGLISKFTVTTTCDMEVCGRDMGGWSFSESVTHHEAALCVTLGGPLGQNLTCGAAGLCP